MVSLALYIVYDRVVRFFYSTFSLYSPRLARPALCIEEVDYLTSVPHNATVYFRDHLFPMPMRPVRREIVYRSKTKQCRVKRDYIFFGEYYAGYQQWIPGVGPATVERMFKWALTGRPGIEVRDTRRPLLEVQGIRRVHHHQVVNLEVPAFWAYVPFKDTIWSRFYRSFDQNSGYMPPFHGDLGTVSAEHLCSLECGS